jgi:hypothetical protein
MSFQWCGFKSQKKFFTFANNFFKHFLNIFLLYTYETYYVYFSHRVKFLKKQINKKNRKKNKNKN